MQKELEQYRFLSPEERIEELYNLIKNRNRLCFRLFDMFAAENHRNTFRQARPTSRYTKAWFLSPKTDDIMKQEKIDERYIVLKAVYFVPPEYARFAYYTRVRGENGEWYLEQKVANFYNVFFVVGLDDEYRFFCHRIPWRLDFRIWKEDWPITYWHIKNWMGFDMHWYQIDGKIPFHKNIRVQGDIIFTLVDTISLDQFYQRVLSKYYDYLIHIIANFLGAFYFAAYAPKFAVYRGVWLFRKAYFARKNFRKRIKDLYRYVGLRDEVSFEEFVSAFLGMKEESYNPKGARSIIFGLKDFWQILMRHRIKNLFVACNYLGTEECHRVRYYLGDVMDLFCNIAKIVLRKNRKLRNVSSDSGNNLWKKLINIEQRIEVTIGDHYVSYIGIPANLTARNEQALFPDKNNMFLDWHLSSLAETWTGEKISEVLRTVGIQLPKPSDEKAMRYTVDYLNIGYAYLDPTSNSPIDLETFLKIMHNDRNSVTIDDFDIWQMFRLSSMYERQHGIYFIVLRDQDIVFSHNEHRTRSLHVPGVSLCRIWLLDTHRAQGLHPKQTKQFLGNIW
ncbi:MAG: hypothetical protein Q6363_008120 [Candidatus Njordarchaeota archaeon]